MAVTSHKLIALKGLVRRLAVATLLLTANALAAELQLNGVLKQGALVQGVTQPGNRVHFNGAAVQVDPAGHFLIGFGRDAPPRAELLIHGEHARPEQHVLQVEQRSYQEQRIDGLPADQVSPRSAETLERIRQEATLVKRARRIATLESHYVGGFRWPMDTGIITGVYGSRRILNGKPRRPHYGVDIAAPTDTPVYAPAAGVVSLVHRDMYFTGGTLIIDHGHGLSSTMMHLQRIHVQEGTAVTPGLLVGRVGATGRATGPHLDWRINLFQKRLDPELIPGLGPFPH